MRAWRVIPATVLTLFLSAEASLAETAISETSGDLIPCVDVFSQRKYDPPGKSFRRVLNVVFHPEKGLKGDLYLPEGAGPHPIVLFIHGGGWVAGSRRMLNAVSFGEHLACRDYAMFDIDYELAPINKSPGLEQDCKCAIRWLKGMSPQLGLDKKKFYVTGGSAGGHLTGMVAVTAKESRFDPACSSFPNEDLAVAGAIPFYGVFDFNLFVDQVATVKGMAEAFLGPNPTREDLARVSPVTYVSADSPPFLLIHGKADLLPHGQSIRMHEALTAAGVSSELLLIEGATHAFDVVFNTEWTKKAVEAMDRTLDKWSGKK
ncbi:MAG: alpha/beta hydrolase [Nitrospirae bacterium]|nr:alpha/beta hydrolase [Nitrospirota bacterium]